MWWWRSPEDEKQAGGWSVRHLGGNHAREDFVVRGIPPLMSIWKSPSLVVRLYADGRVTLAESEWRKVV